MIAVLKFSRRLRLSRALLLLTVPALAKDTPLEVIEWPANGTPALRFTLDKFKQLQGSSRMRGYLLNVAVQNLSPRLIPAARFSLYFFDKNKVRVGEDFIAVNNLGPGETVKLRFTTSASGVPVSLSIQNTAQAPKTVSLTVNQSTRVRYLHWIRLNLVPLRGSSTVASANTQSLSPRKGSLPAPIPRGAPVPNLPAPTTNP